MVSLKVGDLRCAHQGVGVCFPTHLRRPTRPDLSDGKMGRLGCRHRNQQTFVGDAVLNGDHGTVGDVQAYSFTSWTVDLPDLAASDDIFVNSYDGMLRGISPLFPRFKLLQMARTPQINLMTAVSQEERLPFEVRTSDTLDPRPFQGTQADSTTPDLYRPQNTLFAFWLEFNDYTDPPAHHTDPDRFQNFSSVIRDLQQVLAPDLGS